jgi:transposase
MVSRLYREYESGKIIAVADSAQNTGNNIYYLDRGGMKYVFSQSIRAHFLICYVALVILRLIQKRTGHVHSTASLIEAMNRISCSHEGGILFLFDYRSDVSDDIGNAFGLDFSMQRLTRAEIKKNIGSVKKG